MIEPRSNELAYCVMTTRQPQHNTSGPCHSRVFVVFTVPVALQKSSCTENPNRLRVLDCILAVKLFIRTDKEKGTHTHTQRKKNMHTCTHAQTHTQSRITGIHASTYTHECGYQTYMFVVVSLYPDNTVGHVLLTSLHGSLHWFPVAGVTKPIFQIITRSA